MSDQASALSRSQLPPWPLRLRTWLYIALVLTYLASRLTHAAGWNFSLSILSFIAILVSLPSAGVIARVLSLILLGGGSWMLVVKGVSWITYLSAYGEMAYLLALFAVLPCLSVPVQLGGYTKAIQAVLHGRVTTVFQLNCLVTILAYLCGSFMSLAAVPVMMTSMGPVVANYPIRHKQRFIVVSAVCGYVLPILWTPMSGVVGVVLNSLHVEWMRVFPALLVISLAVLVLQWGVFYWLELRGSPPVKVLETTSSIPADLHAAPGKKLMQMALAIVLLISCIILLDRWWQLGLVMMVTLVAVPFAFVWSAMLGKGREFFRDTRWQLLTRLPRMSDQFAIFLCAGFFVQAMRMSGFDHVVNHVFVHIHDLLGTQLFLLALPVMALAASFLGIHPLVLIALLGESLKPDILGVAAPRLAIALVGSAVVTYMQGPFSGTLGLVQSLTQVPTFRISLWTAPYAAAYLALLFAVILMGVGG